MSNQRLLFHGSRSRFESFDPRFAKSGEGVGTFEGWHFIEHLKGAYYHVNSFLKALDQGLIYVCLIPDDYTIPNCEEHQTDSIYQGQAVGVKYHDSDKIQIVEVLEAKLLTDEIVGDNKSYTLSDHQAELEGGVISFLRRMD